MNSILPMWVTCWAPSDLPLASCGLQNTQEKSNLVTKGWDDEARDTVLQHMMFETI